MIKFKLSGYFIGGIDYIMRGFVLILLVFVIIALFPINVFSQNPQQEGMKFYINGMDAFQNEEYKKAQELLERALTVYPNIESKVKNIKLILGIAAFYNGDYEKAKTYLELFKDNPIAQELLEKIPENIAEESIEDLNFLGTSQVQINEESSTIVAVKSSATSATPSNSPVQFFKLFLVGSIVFLTSFTALFLVEYKFQILSGLIEKLFSKIPSKGKHLETNLQYNSEDLKTTEIDFEKPYSNQIFFNVDIDEYSKKDLEGVEELLKEAEEETKNIQVTTVTNEKNNEPELANMPSNPKEAILSSFKNEQIEDNQVTGETIKSQSFNSEDLTEYLDDEELKMKAEQLIKELGVKEENSEWKDAEEFAENPEEQIKELENKEEYNKQEIEKILSYVSNQTTENEGR